MTQNGFKKDLPSLPLLAVADLGEGPGGAAPCRLFWVKKEEMTEGKKVCIRQWLGIVFSELVRNIQ